MKEPYKIVFASFIEILLFDTIQSLKVLQMET